jgi:hypothetical protein
MSLPPLLVVTPGVRDERVRIHQDPRCVPERAGAFGALLADSRESRGLPATPTVFAAQDPRAPDVAPGEGLAWVPHLYRWGRGGEPAIAWELAHEDDVLGAIEAPAADVRRWARRTQQLLRLARLAPDEPKTATDGYLSMRWILTHECETAAALCNEMVELEHVSLHVDPDEHERLLAVLVEGLGLVEVARPGSITVPGNWLQAGHARIHLNSRTGREGERGFPGTAPNHICVAVADLDAAVAAVEAAGFDVVRAGSLSEQAWWRLKSGTAIEMQPLRPRRVPPHPGIKSEIRSAPEGNASAANE